MLEISLIKIGVLFFSLSIHEASHGLVAYAFGDPTAKHQGRLSLNPLVHVDLFGTILLPILLMFSGLPVVGWAKPVQVNCGNFQNPVRDGGFTALAGPASNFILALISAFLLTYLRGVLPVFLNLILQLMVFTNIALAFFNILPLAPLDGSKIIGLIVPKRFHSQYLKFLDKSTTYFIIILLFDIYVMPSIIGYSVFGYFLQLINEYVSFIIYMST